MGWGRGDTGRLGHACGAVVAAPGAGRHGCARGHLPRASMSCASTTGATRTSATTALHCRDRRFGLQHGRFLPARRAQSVPRHRSGRRLFPLRLRRPAYICASTSPGSAGCRSAMSARSSRAGSGRDMRYTFRGNAVDRAHDRAKRRRQRLCDLGHAARLRFRRPPSASIPIWRSRRSPIIIRPRSTPNRSGQER